MGLRREGVSIKLPLDPIFDLLGLVLGDLLGEHGLIVTVEKLGVKLHSVHRHLILLVHWRLIVIHLRSIHHAMLVH